MDNVWNACDGEIWDYEKVFYAVKLQDGTEVWAYPNAGKLTNVGFDKNSGKNIPIEDVASYREAEDEYFNVVEMHGFYRALLTIQPDAHCIRINDGEITFVVKKLGAYGEDEFCRHEFINKSMTYKWFGFVYKFLVDNPVKSGDYF